MVGAPKVYSRLSLAVYPRAPLLEPPTVFELGRVLSTTFPEFASVGLSADDDDEPIWLGEREPESVLAQAGIRDGLGDVALRPRGVSDVNVYLLGSRRTGVDPRANAILIDFEPGSDMHQRALAVFRALVGTFECNYGRLGALDEFSAFNMHTGTDGTFAVGVELRSGLPGIYWANFLGARLVESIGHDFVAAGWELQGAGVLRVLYERPEDWASEQAALARRKEIIDWGQDWVFDRRSPDRPLKSPSRW